MPPDRIFNTHYFFIFLASYGKKTGPLPELTFQGIFLHPDNLNYSPNNDLIHADHR